MLIVDREFSELVKILQRKKGCNAGAPYTPCTHPDYKLFSLAKDCITMTKNETQKTFEMYSSCFSNLLRLKKFQGREKWKEEK